MSARVARDQPDTRSGIEPRFVFAQPGYLRHERLSVSLGASGKKGVPGGERILGDGSGMVYGPTLTSSRYRRHACIIQTLGQWQRWRDIKRHSNRIRNQP
jgi:hypothetical protein